MSNPSRVVSLISSATEMLYLLGAGDRVVGISHECDWPPETSGKPRVTYSRVDSGQSSRAIDEQVRELSAAGSPLYEVDAKLLEELRPELIVTQSQCDVCAVRYEDVVDLVARSPVLRGTPIVALNPQSLADVLEDLRRIGTAIGTPEQADRAVAELRGRIDRVQERTRDLPRPRVVCIEWIEPLMTAANWVPELVHLAGGDYRLGTAGQHSGYTDWDQVRQYDPELIILSPCGFDLQRTLEEAQSLRKQPAWTQLTAVQQHRVFALDGNAYLNRSGPRLVDTLEILAHLLHPEHCPSPLDPEEQRRAWGNWMRG